MAFLKKKKYKFQVEIKLEELTAVPFTNAVLFAKVRLLDGGNFEAISSREEVTDHVAKWDASFSFLCKMTASVSTGTLEPCICRVSVRKEAKGGKACQKLGFVDFNLAEFAGRGLTTKRFLLEGYDSKHRQDNSMLKLSIQMTLSSGDPCFKVPVTRTPGAPGEVVESTEVTQESSIGRIPSATFTDYSEGDSPTNGQLNIDDFAKHCQTVTSEAVTSPSVPETEGRTHSRNSSNHSGSGTSGFGSTTVGPGHYGSLGSQHTQHSRQSSSGDSGHMRNASNGSSGHSDIGSIDRKHHNPGSVSLERRKKLDDARESKFDATRVDPDNLVDELLRATDLQVGSKDDEGSGLQLFIGKDGSTTLGTRQPAGVYKPVIVEER